MPYLLLILGLLIGLYALYRFFLNANTQQIKALFMMAILGVLCIALLILALTGKLPAAIAILVALFPLIGGWLRAKRNHEQSQRFEAAPDEITTREQALQILGLHDDANEELIQKTYKKLMQKVHPDNEGSEWIAAKLNQARDILTKK